MCHEDNVIVLFTHASETKTGFHLRGKQSIAFQCTDTVAGQNQSLSGSNQNSNRMRQGIKLDKSASRMKYCGQVDNPRHTRASSIIHVQ